MISSDKNYSADSAHVVVTKADSVNYLSDFVALPSDYGSGDYYSRSDVRAIKKAVHENLSTLDSLTGFTQRIKARRVVIKPNLVTVFHNFGFVKRDYPNTTDPRALDAAVMFFKEFTSDITIAESSGRGVPTRGSFKVAGIDRLAKRYGIKLMPLEEQPVDRYILPRAAVMKEIIVPEIFSEIAEGGAFYVSMPKMKTNLYTGVTLGFKNGMGCLPYNLRQRNHTFDIDRKLVDMLYLFKPDIVIIDGIVGAEGQCPAPVDPVESGLIVSGNNSVETDREAARLMGFDPSSVDLIRISDEAGFGDAEVKITGSADPLEFRKADPSLMSEGFAELFPGVRVLVGHAYPHSPFIKDAAKVTPDTVREMELSCRGGCLATVRVGFDYFYHEGLDRNFEMTLIIGSGVKAGDDTFYFDRYGNPYTIEDIRALPGKKLSLGSCAAEASGAADDHIEGCMIAPNSAHMMIHKLSGRKCRIVSYRGPSFFTLAGAVLRMRLARIAVIMKGHRLDCEESFSSDIVYPEEGGEDVTGPDYTSVPLPGTGAAERLRLIGKEISETAGLLFQAFI